MSKQAPGTDSPGIEPAAPEDVDTTSNEPAPPSDAQDAAPAAPPPPDWREVERRQQLAVIAATTLLALTYFGSLVAFRGPAEPLRDPDARDTLDGLEGALHGILATAACHAATRKGDRLEAPEVRSLLQALDDTVWFPNCPHGRPILSALDGAELGRRFLRR